MSNEKHKTIKAAKEAFYHNPKSDEYAGDEIRVKGRVLVRNANFAKSATEWGKRGFKIKPNQEPHDWRFGRVGGDGGKNLTWAVYREDQVEPKRKVAVKPPQIVDVMAAVWTVNRAAKRCRDAAQACYQAGAHGLAGHHKEKKESFYRLKAQAINYLLADGRLQIVGFHAFPDGNFAEVLKGEGYTFHRPCPPQEGVVPQLEGIEAKPRNSTEPRLKDAVHTLTEFLADKPIVDCYQWPAPIRNRPTRCWWNDEDDEWDDDGDGDGDD